jgi:hypothetical protein
MAHVIKACADQAEAINADLPNMHYYIQDILPKGEKDLNELKNEDCLAYGDQYSMAPLINPGSVVYNTFKKVIWNGEETELFHCKVCSIWFLAMSLLIFYY